MKKQVIITHDGDDWSLEPTNCSSGEVVGLIEWARIVARLRVVEVIKTMATTKKRQAKKH